MMYFLWSVYLLWNMSTHLQRDKLGHQLGGGAVEGGQPNVFHFHKPVQSKLLKVQTANLVPLALTATTLKERCLILIKTLVLLGDLEKNP